jgi:hypothetical protein
MIPRRLFPRWKTPDVVEGFFRVLKTDGNVVVSLVISRHQRATASNQIPLFPQQTAIMTDPYGEFEDSDEMEVRGRVGKGTEGNY